jgi:2-oxo-3-hexenedioate decarboxylase
MIHVRLIYQRLQSAAMLADELIELHARPREVPPFTFRDPGLSPDQGYAASLALHRRRLADGWKPVGRKIGFTNRTIWPRYGVYEPIWGTVYDRTLIASERGRARIPLEGLVQPRIEPEVCFGMRSRPRATDAVSLLEAIEWIAHSIEIVQCFHPGWKVKLPDCTASNGLHGRLTVGTRVPIGRIEAPERTLAAFSVELRREAETVDRGGGANVLGSPLLALAHLVGILERSGAEPLAAGEIISTGTLTDAHPVKAGECWSTHFEGLPLDGLSVEFA